MSEPSPKARPTPVTAMPQDTRPPSVLMYAAGFVVTYCGLHAVGLALNDPRFSSLTMAMTIVGFLVSFIVRQQNVRSGPIEALVALLFAAICMNTLLGATGAGGYAPHSGQSDNARGIAMVLSWLVVLRSYTLITNLRLLFSCVPTIAMIGLIGTLVTEPSLVTLFAVFIIAACFMIVHDAFLSARTVQASRRAPKRASMIGSQVLLALLCSVTAAILANAVVLPLDMIGSSLLPPASVNLPGGSQTSAANAANTHTTFAEQPQVRIATGPVQLGEQVVMRVRADHGAYWRGATFDEYTGHGWRNNLRAEFTVEGKTPAFEFTGGEDHGPSTSYSDQRVFDLPVTAVNSIGAAHHPLRQTVAMEGPGSFHTIYACAETRTVRLAHVRIRADSSGGVYLTDMIPCTSYIAESDVVDATPDQLRAATGPIPDTLRSIYLDLGAMDPEALNRVRQAAVQAAAGARNSYDRVRALVDWIGANCRYNTNAAAAPSDQDVVDHFLFTSKEGYCDSFAAALAVMCRSIGIPARIASGFATGDYDPRSQEFLVREKHKHQWTEVYFPKIGWVTFDATSGSQDVSSSADKKGSRGARGLLGLLFQRGWIPPLALGLVLTMLGYVAKVEFLDKIRLRRAARFHDLDLPETNRAVVAAYEAACVVLSTAGITRSPADTPNEFLRSASRPLAAHPETLASLETLTRLVSRHRYSGAPAPSEDSAGAVAAVEQIRKAIRAVRRDRARDASALATGSN